MTREEIKTIIAMIQAVYPNWKVTKVLVDVWESVLGEYPKAIVLEALRSYLSINHAFPPTPGHIATSCRSATLPRALLISGEEAMSDDSDLAVEARGFSQRQYPWDSRAQYASPEELQKAQAINQAQRRRAFTERYEAMKARAMALVTSGCAPTRAIDETLGSYGTGRLSAPIQALIDSTIKKVAA